MSRAGALSRALAPVGLLVAFCLGAVPAQAADSDTVSVALDSLSPSAPSDGDTLTVSGTNRTLHGDETPEALSGDFVAVSVTDTGAGIPADLLGKIVEPFFTTKGDGKGTGLGLSQAYGFARQSGGALAVTSEVGHGTTVTLYLPRRSEPVAPFVAAGGSLNVAGHGETVLVIEDNADVRSVAVSLLEQLDYRVVTVENAQAALDLIAAGTPVDLVFSDVMLPGPLDGLGLAEKLTRQHPDVPVLLTTGYARVLTQNHPFPILRKPYQMAALAEAVSKAVAGRHGETVSAGI